MPIYGFLQRVVCYVTRSTERGDELLVFEHVDDDPADPSGVQVPAGSMLPFESVQDAALREVEEETGLRGLTYVDQVGAVELGLDDEGGPSMTNFVRLTAPADGEPAWEHVVTGDGEDAGMGFSCRWEAIPLSSELAGGQSAFVDRLGG